MQALEYPEISRHTVVFEPYFVAAGLEIEFAPWAEQGSRYLKVTLTDDRFMLNGDVGAENAK